jgi:protein involved in polysaccharide export with SLBB domain
VVLGKVNKAGDVRMEDNREYRLADAVAAAGGVAPNGSTMRVYLARRTESGRVEVVEYRLEAFLKDGNMEQNPIVQEGDVVVVGEPKGLTAGAAIQVISAASILRTIFGN